MTTITLHLTTRKANQLVAALEARAADHHHAMSVCPPGSIEHGIVTDALRACEEMAAEVREELGWDKQKALYDEWQAIDEAVAGA